MEATLALSSARATPGRGDDVAPAQAPSLASPEATSPDMPPETALAEGCRATLVDKIKKYHLGGGPED